MTPEPQHRFLVLDGMRGVAALGVLAFHVTVSATQDFQQLASFYLFVDFFFVLSGFVLWPSMPQHGKQQSGKISSANKTEHGAQGSSRSNEAACASRLAELPVATDGTERRRLHGQ